LANILRFYRRDRASLAQVTLAFLPLARKQMAFETLVPFDLAAAGNSEPLGGSSVGFDFRHLASLRSQTKMMSAESGVPRKKSSISS
jgi:hypothetical protein